MALAFIGIGVSLLLHHIFLRSLEFRVSQLEASRLRAVSGDRSEPTDETDY